MNLVHSQTRKTYLFLGVQMQILLTSDETGRQFSLIEGIMPPGGDGGLHVHVNEDESMLLIDGELEVTVGEQTFTLTPGGRYFAPRGIPHRLQNRKGVPARALLITTPGGFDQFISQVGIPLGEGAPPTAISSSDSRANGRVVEGGRNAWH
jgi:mannose-6-phosphate isomerase-like protein (cupin superfamily)